MSEDLYTLFNIPRDADSATIGKQLDREQRKWATRTNAPGVPERRKAEDMLEAAVRARAILLDPVRRAEHDRELAGAETPQPVPQPPQPKPQPAPQPSPKPRDWLAEARRRRDAGDLPGAIYEARQGVASDDRNPAAWLLLGDLHRQNGNHHDALHEFQRAAALTSRDPVPLRLAGDTAAALKDYNTAVTYYRQALVLDPWHSPTKGALASNLAVLGAETEALQHYEQLLAASPSDAAVRNYVAKLRWKAATQRLAWQMNGLPRITGPADIAVIMQATDIVHQVQPTDEELAATVAAAMSAVAQAVEKQWRWRASMVLVVIGWMVLGALLATMPAFDTVALSWGWFALLVATLRWMGRKPRWWHDAYRRRHANGVFLKRTQR